MKDIRKPLFMQEAANNQGHNVFMELCIAMLVFIVGSMLTGIVQVPAMMVYLFKDTDYLAMIQSGDVDIQKIMTLAMNVPEWMMIMILISEIFLIVIVGLYCRFLEKRKLNTLGFIKKSMIREYLKGLAAGLVIFSVAYLLCVISGSITMDGISTDMVPLYIVGYFFGYMIQGMAEEVLCRGYLFVSLTKRCHVTTAAIISAIFFAALHGMNSGVSALAFINLFLFGIFAALLFVDCGNIWVVGAFHSIWNFVQGNLYGVQVSGNSIQNSVFTSTMADDGRTVINGGSFGMEGGLAVTIVLICAVGLVVYHLQKKGAFIDKSEQPSWTEIQVERINKQMANGQNPWDNESNMNNNTQNYINNQNVQSTNTNAQATEVLNSETSEVPNSETTKKAEPEQPEQTSFNENYFKD